MIIVITTVIVDEVTGRNELVASHGYNVATDRLVILPTEHPRHLGAVYSPDYDEWIIYPERKEK